MFKLELDYSELEKAAQTMGASIDQVPYALTLALNRSADITRSLLINATWPQHVNARNTSFIAASLTTKQARASKTSLSVEIYDKLDRGNLIMQSLGGTRAPQGGSNLAVPESNVPKTSRGVPARLRPKNAQNILRKGDVLYQRQGKGKNKRLRLLYVLKTSTKIPKRVPFYEDYEASMSRELARTLPLAIEKAMATRR